MKVTIKVSELRVNDHFSFNAQQKRFSPNVTYLVIAKGSMYVQFEKHADTPLIEIGSDSKYFDTEVTVYNRSTAIIDIVNCPEGKIMIAVLEPVTEVFTFRVYPSLKSAAKNYKSFLTRKLSEIEGLHLVITDHSDLDKTLPGFMESIAPYQYRMDNIYASKIEKHVHRAIKEWAFLFQD